MLVLQLTIQSLEIPQKSLIMHNIKQIKTEYGIINYNKNDKYIGEYYSKGQHWDSEIISNYLREYVKKANTI